MLSPREMIDDRPDDNVFRVNRAAFTDANTFDREMSEIFDRCWLYIGHASQVPDHGDYIATRLGLHPVFVIRGSDGEVRCFYDACSHRGSKLTGRTSGNAKTMTCRYHGWCFNADGDCTLVRGGDEAYRSEDLERMGTNLRPIEQFGEYKGFLFGCLDVDAPSLLDFLGGALPFIDLMADQAPDEMEVLRGESRYIMEANWKLQTENSTDGYHVATVHRNFATTVGYRETLAPDGGGEMVKTEASRILSLDKIGSGGYDVGNGHMINWADRGNPEAGPSWPQRGRLLQKYPEGKSEVDAGTWPHRHSVPQSTTERRCVHLYPRLAAARGRSDRNRNLVYCAQGRSTRITARPDPQIRGFLLPRQPRRAGRRTGHGRGTDGIGSSE